MSGISFVACNSHHLKFEMSLALSELSWESIFTSPALYQHFDAEPYYHVKLGPRRKVKVVRYGSLFGDDALVRSGTLMFVQFRGKKLLCGFRVHNGIGEYWVCDGSGVYAKAVSALKVIVRYFHKIGRSDINIQESVDGFFHFTDY